MDITGKIDVVTKIGDERIKAGGIQPAPKSVKIEITDRCNLRCKFCALRTRKKPLNTDMDLDYFKRITEDMKRCGVEEIGLFFLGESFMAPKLLARCCEWAKKQLEFEWVFLTSNGVMAKPEWVDEVMAAGLDSLKWSVNYFGYTTFHEITGGSAKQYDRMLENIMDAYKVRKVGQHDCTLSASSILFSYDRAFIGNVRAFLTRHINPFVDRHYWLPLYQMAMYKKEIIKSLGYVPTAGNMGRLDDDTLLPTRSPLPCWTCFTEGHVRVDGNVSACCFGADARFDMGKLDGKNFMKCWNSDKFIKLREAQLDTLEKGPNALIGTPCRVCVAYDEADQAEKDRHWASLM